MIYFEIRIIIFRFLMSCEEQRERTREHTGRGMVAKEDLGAGLATPKLSLVLNDSALRLFSLL